MTLPLDADLLSRLLDAQTAIATADPDLATVMDLVARRSQELTGSEGTAVELAEGADMVYRAVSGMASGQMGLRIHRQGSFSGLCVERGEAMICDDSETDGRVDREACRKVGLRSMVVQPLVHHGTAVGVIKVLSSRPAFFSHAAADILGHLARTVAGAMVNAARWAELSSRNVNLTHLASHDALTGIKNRSAFYDQLRRTLAGAKRTGSRFALALFDLDGLKDVNDSHGHQAGDFFIRSFAERLARRVRASDTVARLGGDEFGVLLSPLETGEASLGRDLVRNIEGPVVFEGTALDLRASAGVALFDDDGADPETLVARADERLYEDKRARKGA
jgi:diguanylate cyclase (GGDEF)-like protein